MFIAVNDIGLFLFEWLSPTSPYVISIFILTFVTGSLGDRRRHLVVRMALLRVEDHVQGFLDKIFFFGGDFLILGEGIVDLVVDTLLALPMLPAMLELSSPGGGYICPGGGPL